MQKRKLSTYNDGVVHVYRERPRKTEFGAKKNISTLEDMDFIIRLDYEESSRREEDLEFAEKAGFSLTLKIKTRTAPGVDNKCKAVVDGYLYDVRYIDKTRTEMWLFMEGVRRLDT